MYTLSAIISETTSDCAIRSWIWTQQPFLNCSQAETKRPRTVMGTLSRSSLAPWILKISVVFKDYPGLISINITGNNLHWIGFEILQESIVRIVFYPDIWGVSCRKHLNKQFQDRRSSFCGVLLVFSNWAAEVVVKLPQNMFVAKTILRPTIYFSIYGWTGSMFNPKAGIHILSHLGFLFISVFPFFSKISERKPSQCLPGQFPVYMESVSHAFSPVFMNPCLQYSSKKLYRMFQMIFPVSDHHGSTTKVQCPARCPTSTPPPWRRCSH